ncbi:hypothetical protein [Tardibacter chloracetimidivorans]|uniref:hypothetical protein n=1 Tax=Tardibacter chloracetimidivorans TaxID=1921510 RepID=UPI001300E3D4|nr:hypothetical protein [Tardibacter chloracetimidivorans]
MMIHHFCEIEAFENLKLRHLQAAESGAGAADRHASTSAPSFLRTAPTRADGVSGLFWPVAMTSV